ncbi:MAG: FAD-dependent oxidoreductase [Elusimicrobiota bacterium]
MLIIIGAGPTGLSCGYRLKGKVNFLIVEKENEVGGIASSVKKDGFIFDYSGHLLHLRWDETKNFVLRLLDKNYLKIKRNAQIYLKGNYVDYPFQINLYNLPPDLKSNCVRDFLKATLNKKTDKELNFKKWALETFGKSICNYFMFPYNKKLFAYPLDKITTKWLGDFVPKPNINMVLKGAYQRKIENIGYNPFFYYPKYGGIKNLADAMAKKIQNNIMKNSQVIKVSLKNKEIFLKNGQSLKYSKLINTMPLKKFILISDAPYKIKEAAKNLKHNSIYILNLGVKKINFKQHWIYFPEEKFIFYRLGFYSNFSPHLCPKNSTSLYIEISVKENETIDFLKAEKSVIKDILELGIIKSEKDIITKTWLKVECGYVIYDFLREKSLEIIFNYLKENSVISTGRYGGWKYSFIEENIKDGFDTAKSLL